MAALLRRVRVAQLYDPEFDPAAAQRLLDALEPRLRSITIRFGKLRDTIAYLHALAKLRSPPPTAPAGVAGLPGATNADGDDVGAAATATISAGSQLEGRAAVLGQPSELVLDLAVWATRDRTQTLQASPRRLATLLWALLQTLPPDQYSSEKLQMVLDRVALCSIRQWQNLAPQDMRVFAVAYATFGPRGVPKATGDCAAAQGNLGSNWLGSMSSWPEPKGKRRTAMGGPGSEPEGDGAGAAGSGSSEVKEEQRRKRNALVMKVAADHLAARVGDLTVGQPEPRDLALAAHALALQGTADPHLPLLVKAGDAAVSAPSHSLQPLELVLLVEALAVYGVRQAALLETVRQRAQHWAGSTLMSSSAAATTANAQQLYGRLAKAFERLGVAL